MTDAAFGHDRDGDALHDLLHELWRAHPRHAAGFADVGRYALQRHDGDRAGVFGDFGLVGGDHVHDDAALQHLGQAGFEIDDGSAAIILSVLGGRFLAHVFKSLTYKYGMARIYAYMARKCKVCIRP